MVVSPSSEQDLTHLTVAVTVVNPALLACINPEHGPDLAAGIVAGFGIRHNLVDDGRGGRCLRPDGGRLFSARPPRIRWKLSGPSELRIANMRSVPRTTAASTKGSQIHHRVCVLGGSSTLRVANAPDTS